METYIFLKKWNCQICHCQHCLPATMHNVDFMLFNEGITWGLVTMFPCMEWREYRDTAIKMQHNYLFMTNPWFCIPNDRHEESLHVHGWCQWPFSRRNTYGWCQCRDNYCDFSAAGASSVTDICAIQEPTTSIFNGRSHHHYIVLHILRLFLKTYFNNTIALCSES